MNCQLEIISISLEEKLIFYNQSQRRLHFMTNKERKDNGLVYRYDDPDIMGKQLNYMEKLYDYNSTRPLEQNKRQQLL